MSVCNCPAKYGRPWHRTECPATIVEIPPYLVVNSKLAEILVPQALQPVLPTGHAERNALPLCTGCLDYFPLALAEVAKLSAVANEQHNPGEPVHWARGKSTEHRDKIMKHLVDSGTLDADGMRHSAKIAWRALALLQEEMEAAGGRPGRGSKFPTGDIVK